MRPLSGGIVIGRILKSVDFERVLAGPICARSPHFAVHFLATAPSHKTGAGPVLRQAKLSTTEMPTRFQAVDDVSPEGIWLGAVVPKRHARRAVTRTLLRRQIRQAVDHQARVTGHAGTDGSPPCTIGLPKGLWVVRLRMPFDKQKFPSAFSQALRLAAADELSKVLAQAAYRVLA